MRHAPIRSGSLRRASIVLASVAGLLMATGSVASAAPLIQLLVHDTCVTGHNYVANGHMHVVQQRGPTDIATVNWDTNSYTDWNLCGFKPILAGDVFHVNETGIDPEIHFDVTVPGLEVSLNPSTNKESGHVPTPSTALNASVYPTFAGLNTYSIVRGLIADGSGNFVTDWTGTLDIGTGDVATLLWEDSVPNRFIVSWAAPSLGVQVGKSTVAITGPYGPTTTARLRTSKGVLRGTATGKVAGTRSSASASFKSGGRSIRVRAGDRVTSSGLKGSYRVRASDVVVKKPGNGSLTATCAPGSEYAIFYNRGGIPVIGKAGANGRITNNNVTKGTGPILPGSLIELACRLPSGFGQVFAVTVK